jgi:hypothetical protein
MGNGGLTPDNLQAQIFIVPALNEMFDPAAGLPLTQANFRQLKRFYRRLGEHAAHDQGASRRQRTLRHLAWLLTAEFFDDPTQYPYPNNRFRLWLRYLTWIEHIAANYKVTVDGQPSNLTPAAAIKATLLRSLQNGTQVIFDWKPPASAAYELTVEVIQNVSPMRINVTSIKEESIPSTISSDDDDLLDQA